MGEYQMKAEIKFVSSASKSNGTRGKVVNNIWGCQTVSLLRFLHIFSTITSRNNGDQKLQHFKFLYGWGNMDIMMQLIDSSEMGLFHQREEI